jgi:hypothetical protein
MTTSTVADRTSVFIIVASSVCKIDRRSTTDPIPIDVHDLLQEVCARGNAMLPTLAVEVDLQEIVPLLGLLPKIEGKNAVALVRAARLYSNAIWIADDDPNWAWLQLVSAIEAAAVQHKDTEKLKPTKRFLTFMTMFLPALPSQRPGDFAQIGWSDVSNHLKTIYRYRSRALHEGLPFPGPMCEPPMTCSPDTYDERPSWSWSQHGTSIWTAGDAPMYLHVFEHLARQSLLSWWRSLAW